MCALRLQTEVAGFRLHELGSSDWWLVPSVHGLWVMVHSQCTEYEIKEEEEGHAPLLLVLDEGRDVRGRRLPGRVRRHLAWGVGVADAFKVGVFVLAFEG